MKRPTLDLNISRKPEYSLQETHIDELIEIYGIPCLYLFSEQINQDTVFQDFSHNKVTPGKSVQIKLLPDEESQWEGETIFNKFGFYNNYSQTLYISKRTILSLYPKFLEEKGERSKIQGSLILLPSGGIVEVTNISEHHEGINNLWAYADQASSYKLTVKPYTKNIADKGTSELKEQIEIKSGENKEIFEYNEQITTEDLDDFFGEFQDKKEQITKEADEINVSNDNVFGELS